MDFFKDNLDALSTVAPPPPEGQKGGRLKSKAHSIIKVGKSVQLLGSRVRLHGRVWEVNRAGENNVK